MKSLPKTSNACPRRSARPSTSCVCMSADSTVKSRLAVKNIKRVCEEHLEGRYHLEVIDIHKHANLARDEQIVAVPTLIKRLPLPLQRLVGDMSDLNKVLFGLDLKVREA